MKKHNLSIRTLFVDVKTYLCNDTVTQKILTADTATRCAIPLNELAISTNDTPRSCPMNVPRQFVHYANHVRVHGGKRTPKEEQYKELATALHNGEVIDKLFAEMYTMELKRRPIIAIDRDNGECTFFRGKTKGDKEYNYDVRNRILFASDKLHKTCNNFAFLTVTYSPNDFGYDRIEAVKKFNNHVAQVMRKLRRYYDIEYVTVMEWTGKCFPHAHILIGCRDEFQEGWFAEKDGANINYGNFYNQIQRTVKSPIFNLKKAGGVGITKYLAKYVAKSVDNAEKLLKGDIDMLSKSDRKQLYTIIMPKISNTRSYRFSQGLKFTPEDNKVDLLPWDTVTDYRDIPEVLAKKDKSIIDKHEQEAFRLFSDVTIVERALNARKCDKESAQALIRLMNKLTIPCTKRVFLWTNTEKPPEVEQLIGYHGRKQEDFNRIFAGANTHSGCKGCWFMTRLKEIAGYTVDYNNIPIMDNSKVYGLYFEKYTEHAEAGKFRGFPTVTRW